MKLVEYVVKHSIRGACKCGRCADACKDGPKHQFCGLTIDLTLFTIGMQDNPDPLEFLKLVTEEQPHWLDGNEHNYLECGADVGDQGIALAAMGLGHLLDVWKCLCPETMMPMLDAETKQMMAGNGMIALKVE